MSEPIANLSRREAKRALKQLAHEGETRTQRRKAVHKIKMVLRRKEQLQRRGTLYVRSKYGIIPAIMSEDEREYRARGGKAHSQESDRRVRQMQGGGF